MRVCGWMGADDNSLFVRFGSEGLFGKLGRRSFWQRSSCETREGWLLAVRFSPDWAEGDGESILFA